MSMSWLDNHLHSFVKPYIGMIPKPSSGARINPIATKTSLDLLISIWEEAKKNCGSKTMLLAGRDVWEFEILARIDDFPTEFRPDISSLTVIYAATQKDYSDYYLIDSGYSGSIPRRLGVGKWNLVSGTQSIMGYNVPTSNNVSASHIASHLERAPKYWTRARMVNGKIKQSRSAKATFTAAARVTIAIAKYYMAYKAAQPRPVRTIGRGI